MEARKWQMPMENLERKSISWCYGSCVLISWNNTTCIWITSIIPWHYHRNFLILRRTRMAHCAQTEKITPKNWSQKKLKNGEHFWLRKKKVYVSKWKNKRPVLVLTTQEHPEMVEVRNRHGKRPMKPIEVASYNAHMCGIDRCDQMISYYSSPRKTIRWYKKVLFHLLDIALWNSFYLFTKYVKQNNKYEFVAYREEIIREMLKLEKDTKGKDLMTRKKNDSRRYGPRQIGQAAAFSINSGHWPVRTSYRCPGCPDSRGLCQLVFESDS